MNLVRSARAVITDSGGVQEESTYLGIPCLTLRENTERPITVCEGSNRLVQPDQLYRQVSEVLAGRWPPAANRRSGTADRRTLRGCVRAASGYRLTSIARLTRIREAESDSARLPASMGSGTPAHNRYNSKDLRVKVTVFGSGYVGLVTGACFAEAGNNVVCVDIDAGKVARLQQGDIPIHEPGLDTLVKRNFQKGRLRFTTDAEEGIRHGLFQFIAVGTPPEEDGSADLSHVLAVAETIGRHMTEYRIVVDKSTVPVGTADKVRERIDQTLGERGVKIEFDVVSNPEFLKEGAAIADFMKPDRVVVGTDNPRTAELLKTLYDPFTRNRDRMIVMDVRSAELTKYAANAMLATKISFMNEIANLAERVGADIEKVRVGIGSDPRIGYSFIYPGAGYGGSCFPKDVKALVHSAGEHDFDASCCTPSRPSTSSRSRCCSRSSMRSSAAS